MKKRLPNCRNPFWSQVRSGSDDIDRGRLLAEGRNPFWSQVRSGLARHTNKKNGLFCRNPFWSQVRSGYDSREAMWAEIRTVVIPSGVRSGQANSPQGNSDLLCIVVIPSGVRSGQAPFAPVA